jgi:hypothetical protein
VAGDGAAAILFALGLFQAVRSIAAGHYLDVLGWVGMSLAGVVVFVLISFVTRNDRPPEAR